MKILKVEHLDLVGGCLHIMVHIMNGKGRKQRTSILPKPVLEALDAHPQERDGEIERKAEQLLIPKMRFCEMMRFPACSSLFACFLLSNPVVHPQDTINDFND
jgi:hypothetical protein